MSDQHIFYSRISRYDTKVRWRMGRGLQGSVIIIVIKFKCISQSFKPTCTPIKPLLYRCTGVQSASSTEITKGFYKTQDFFWVLNIIRVLLEIYFNKRFWITMSSC